MNGEVSKETCRYERRLVCAALLARGRQEAARERMRSFTLRVRLYYDALAGPRTVGECAFMINTALVLISFSSTLSSYGYTSTHTSTAAKAL